MGVVKCSDHCQYSSSGLGFKIYAFPIKCLRYTARKPKKELVPSAAHGLAQAHLIREKASTVLRLWHHREFAETSGAPYTCCIFYQDS